MSTKVTAFDVSEYLKDESSIAAYLSAIVDEGDPALLLAAIGDIAKARGMSRIANDSGLGRESLYKALNSGAKPRFDTIIKVLNALGVNIAFNPKGNRRIKYNTIRKNRGLHTAHRLKAALKGAPSRKLKLTMKSR
jgi:probable addiction module antidote protein